MLTVGMFATLWVIKRDIPSLPVLCSGMLISTLRRSLNKDQDSSSRPPCSANRVDDFDQGYEASGQTPQTPRVRRAAWRDLEVGFFCVSGFEIMCKIKKQLQAAGASLTMSVFLLNKSKTVFSPRAIKTH